MLSDYIPGKTYAIVASLINNEIAAIVAGASLINKLEIKLIFPKVNPFVLGEKITMHLDNRTGVENIDHTFAVYRSSVKATITQVNGETAFAQIAEYEIAYGSNVVERYQSEHYHFPQDDRAENILLPARLSQQIDFEDGEFDNKLGVLITKGIERPHTTAMAFLSSTEEDIFIISHIQTRKSLNLNRDASCAFAIDHRANYHFEKAYDWNYTIIRGTVKKVERTEPAFTAIQEEFITKNPWEQIFFTDPKVEMFHIVPGEIIYPDQMQRRKTA